MTRLFQHRLFPQILPVLVHGILEEIFSAPIFWKSSSSWANGKFGRMRLKS